MKRFVLLDTAPIPGANGALNLFEHGEDFVIKIAGGDGGQLMNTRMHGSEDALAAIPCKQIASRPAAETGIAREINDKLSRALSPLNDIQSLLKEVRSDLANRPVPQPGVVPESLVKELSHQLQQAITNANAQRTLTQASVSAVALSK